MPLSDPWHFAAFSCAHCPLVDEDALGYVLDQIRLHRPAHNRYAVVMLGDLFEADSASRWPSEYSWTLQDEYVAADDLLRKVREAAGPNARLIFLPGNHDDNILAWGRIDSKLRERCSWEVKQYDKAGRWINEELLTYWERPAVYKYCRKRGCFRLGDVVFAHGYEASMSSGRFEAPYFANEYGLYVHGHTHRPTAYGRPERVMMTQGAPLRYWYANPGCIRELEPNYMARKRKHGWGQGIVVGKAEVNKSPRRSITWECETRIFRMYDDYAERAA